MKKPKLVAAVGAIALATTAVPTFASSRAASTPTVAQAVAAHIKAVEDCDSSALVGGYSANATVFFPDGAIVKGRPALKKVYDSFVKTHADGGYCGLRIKAVTQVRRGGTVFIKFRVTAPFLAKTYFSTDGYVITGGLIVSEVSTFDATKLKFK